MPTFGRLGKHSNRSQHGLPDQPPAGAQSSSGASNPAGSGVVVGDAAAGGGALADSGLDAQSALSPPAGSPHEAIDARQQQQLQHQIQQQQQQQQGLPLLQTPGPNKLQKQQQQPPQLQSHQSQSQAPAPPPQLYSASSTGLATNNPSPLQQHPGGDFVFDARQQPQHPDFVDPTVNRSQSLRYPSQSSLRQQQQQQPSHQHVYGIATSSVDDLPSPASFQQQQPPPQPAPEKQRTHRKLDIIKGIFGSVRGTSDTSSSSQNSSHAPVSHPASQPYDPTNAGLGRRPSNKRVSTRPETLSTLHSQRARRRFL